MMLGPVSGKVQQRWSGTFQPSILRRAGRTTRLNVTMLLTGFPGKPNTSIVLQPCPRMSCKAAQDTQAKLADNSLFVLAQPENGM